MNVKTILPKVNKQTFIEDYLSICGVVDVNEYLHPTGKYIDNPMNYENMQRGLDLLHTYVENKLSTHFYIIHDEDVDGLCSTTITYKFLEHLGIEADRITVLIHKGKQHGLSADIMERLLLASDSLVIIPDAGTNDVEQCKLLSLCNNSVLILDHHDKEVFNLSATIINNQISPQVANKSLCGTGVAWKFITAYCKKYLDNDPFYMSLIDLVNFANLADVMDMRSLENRTISVWCRHINNPFLKRLCDEYIKEDITPESLVWNVAPKLNAVCRLGDSENDIAVKRKVFNAFAVSDDSCDCDEAIKTINTAYRKQKQIVKELYESIIAEHELTDHKIEVVSLGKTQYTGLIASKLMDYYNKPILLVHEENGVLFGSLRSPYPLKNILNKSGLMLLCQGHEQACGVSWKAENTEALTEYCDGVEMPEPIIEVCCSYAPDNIPYDIFGMFDEWDFLYARGVPYPLFHIAPISIKNNDIKLIGANKTTLKFTYKGVDYIKFFVSNKEKELLYLDVLNSRREVWLKLEVVGKLQLNEFRGNMNEQVLIDRFECKLYTPTLGNIW